MSEPQSGAEESSLPATEARELGIWELFSDEDGGGPLGE